VGVALSAALAAAGGWRYARASSPVNGPIILISIDSLRADHLPVYGYRGARTPAIDALAADGIVFERAYAHSPETLPSHAAMLSGRLPFDTGVRDDVGFTIKESERLLPELLRDRGYATAGAVSTFILRKASGIAQGFSAFDDGMAPPAPDAAIGGIARDGAAAERAAEKWLDANGGSRCFLFLQINEPHASYTVDDAGATRAAAYDAQIAAADEIVGRLLRYLKTHQLYDRSTILLTADHGEGLGGHGEQEHGLFVYDETLHVPLIVKQAAGEGSGRRVRDIVGHVDIVPTILDLAKAPDPGGLRGQTLKPLLDGNGRLAGRTLYGESLFGRYHFGWHELLSLTSDRYHYIRGAHEELYDLRADPREARNIADDPAERETLGTMRAAMDKLKVSAPPLQAAVSDADLERFEALGDVGRLAAESDAPAADPSDNYPTLLTYREAVRLATIRQWAQAIERLEPLVRRDPSLAAVWSEIGSFALAEEHYDQAADAYRHAAALQPDNPSALLGAATALFRLRRLDDAREEAERAVAAAEDKDPFFRSSAHEWLVRIALARREPDTAREEADLARAADSKLPLPLYVEGRINYDQGHYAEALAPFEQAAAAERTDKSRPILDLHYYYGDTLARLDRSAEAEAELMAELKMFPRNTRARAALATLLHNGGRDDEAAAAVADLVRLSPTADAFTTAARLWTALGDRTRAADARAEARRLAQPPPLAH
jgi:arylsulfatase A-like enzyme/predicted Zn-dependent protease